MPFTRNTRIKKIKKMNSTQYIAQVQYRIPFTKITWWEDFNQVAYGLVQWQSLKDFNGKKGLDSAKATIDYYLYVYDEKEAGTTVGYIKYP